MSSNGYGRVIRELRKRGEGTDDLSVARAQAAQLTKERDAFERAAAGLQDQLAELRQAVGATADQCDVMRARAVMDYGDTMASKLMGQMASMFRAVLD